MGSAVKGSVGGEALCSMARFVLNTVRIGEMKYKNPLQVFNERQTLF
jgi:hypothetical protein